MNIRFSLSTLAIAVALVGCGSDSDDSTSTGQDIVSAIDAISIPTQYEFNSQFTDFAGESSVSYSGQTARQVLIADLKSLVGSQDLTNLDNKEAVLAQLNALYDKSNSDIDATVYSYSLEAAVIPGPTYGDISSGKDLKGKIAGEDNALRHGTLKGWTTGLDADPTPDEFVQYLFGLVADNVVSQTIRTNPVTGEALPHYVTEDGVDLQQLINKFILMAVAYSQGTGDYLSDDLGEGKGILSSTAQSDGKPYSSLEHHWDEGFGYFGAARDYNDYTDLEIRAKSGRTEYANGYHDANGDGLIDLRSEVNFAASVNAAKRDVGSANLAPTDYTKMAFDAFLAGRALITEQPEGYETALEAQRDIAVNTWEKAYAATVVHYINDTLKDMNKFGTEDYSFENHAKHWSEMKGFAMGLQFNPNALMSIDDVIKVNDLFGDAPVLPTSAATEIEAYKAGLLTARAIFQASYGFDSANMGDENGQNGW